MSLGSKALATPLLPEATSRRTREPHSGITPLPERFLTVSEAARILQVSTASVYRLCAVGRIPHLRVLNAIRIEATALRTLLKSVRNLVGDT